MCCFTLAIIDFHFCFLSLGLLCVLLDLLRLFCLRLCEPQQQEIGNLRVCLILSSIVAINIKSFTNAKTLLFIPSFIYFRTVHMSFVY